MNATRTTDAQRALRLVVLGYITAITMPPIGIAVGVSLAAPGRSERRYARHGAVIIALGLIAAIVWFVLFNSGIADTKSNDLN